MSAKTVAESETMRDAADWLRRRAARMPDGPYGMQSAWTGPQTMLSRVTSRTGVIAEVREHHPADPMRGGMVTDYLSYMTPDFALAVADWLDACALVTEVAPDRHKGLALAVARAYLGETS